ncbi:MAG: hypothetical protein M3Z54_15430 [Gemmatimonadota bacterium]|nr:hypothetical protein [Gemmatimonadota bacterium]
MDREQEAKRIGANELGSDGPKRVYAEPKLTVHGNVEDITKNIGLKNTDGLTGSSIG